ncbi:MAG: hypothetical protein ACOYWZ_10505 [Bacillota bacterium]
MITKIFIALVFSLLLIPITNIILLIVYKISKGIFIKNKLFLAFFLIELLIFTTAILAPIPDGGIFVQLFLGEIVGIIVLVNQITSLAISRRT